MSQRRGRNRSRPDGSLFSEGDEITSEDLLEEYLAMPLSKREESFVDTAQAAEVVGLSRRTIQSWIECGFVRAIVVGRKYKVEMASLHRYLRNRSKMKLS